MKTGLQQHAALSQQLRINPRLYQAMDLLYMPLLDLQQHLKQELLGNPFLELLESEEEQEPVVAEAKLKEDPSRKGALEPLLGKIAIANAKMAYQLFQQVFTSERFLKLRDAGARVRRARMRGARVLRRRRIGRSVRSRELPGVSPRQPQLLASPGLLRGRLRR